MFFDRKHPGPPPAPARTWDISETESEEASPWWPTFEEILRKEEAEVLVLPQVALELMRLIADPASSRQRAIQIVSKDPALTARLLKLANSAYYRGGRPCANIEQSLARVGDKGLRDVLMTASVGRVLNVRGQPELSTRLQARSIAVAMAAEVLASAREMSRDDVFAAGLLHDVGWPIAYGVLMRHRTRFGGAADSPASARNVVESVHAQVGGIAAERWNFPPGIVAAITYHHHPEKAEEGIAAAWLIAAARRVVDALELYPESECNTIEVDPFMARLRMDSASIGNVLTKTRAELVRMQLLPG
jgi:HD-like signal output (HDOD) protein